MGLLVTLGLRKKHQFERPTVLDHLLSSPLQWVASMLYHTLLRLRGRPFVPRTQPPIRVVCLSDTHALDPRALDPHAIPEGDLLIFAGDLTSDGTAAAIQHELDALAALPHRHKVVICGNHDYWFDPETRLAVDQEPGAEPVRVPASLHYLENSAVTLEFGGGRKLNMWGSPASIGPKRKTTTNPWAFGYTDKNPWAGLVPIETDVLVTHTPPYSHLDLGTLGCPGLLEEIWRVKPKLHVFGHIHWGYGRESVFFDRCQRAFDTAMSHPPRGPLGDLLVFPAWDTWRDTARMVWYGMSAILWKLLMEPGPNDAGLLVNAAQMVGNTLRLGNKPIVVDL